MVTNLNIDSSYHQNLNFSAQEIKQVVNYLMKSHAYYSAEVFPEIIENIHLMSEFSRSQKCCWLNVFLTITKHEVDQHFDYENNTVFPYILNLIDANAAGNYSVIDYREHHDDIQEKLDDVKNY